MTQKRVAKWLMCGMGSLAPLGCATMHSKPLDTAIFVPPAIHNEAELSVDPSVEKTDASGSTVASAQIKPDDATILPSTVAGDSANSLPKKASVLADPASSGFESVPPLQPLISSPATAPVATMPPSTPVMQGSATPESSTPAGSTSGSTSASSSIPASSPREFSSTFAASTVAIPELATPAASGVYMTLGGVLAQVNNTPIYANQVLSPLKKEFAAKSRDMEPAAFRDFAEHEIGRQLQEKIEDELTFATAYHALSDEDRRLAEAIAMQVRQERVTAAGGSSERARRLALEDGVDFDETIRQEYRRIVYGLYQRRRIEPLVQVTADDMRENYRMNVAKRYSEKEGAQFRVLKVDPKISGGTEQAKAKVTALHDRAAKGEDFAALASAENDDPSLKRQKGNPFDEGKWMQRNSYLVDAVEAAVWNLQPGQITPVIESDGAFYIAKLEAKRLGSVKPFEDQAVQDDIYSKLRQEQLGALWRKSKDDSIGEAMIVTDDKRIQVAVDMAMQLYAQAR